MNALASVASNEVLPMLAKMVSGRKPNIFMMRLQRL